MARRLSDLTAAVWFVFLCASKYIKLALFLYTSLVPSGSSLTKPAVFTVFRDSCQSARKHYHRKGGVVSLPFLIQPDPASKTVSHQKSNSPSNEINTFFF